MLESFEIKISYMSNFAFQISRIIFILSKMKDVKKMNNFGKVVNNDKT